MEQTSFTIPLLFNDEAFRHDLLTWYQGNKRLLPWRENQDPYRIWVSEIMLQQTQVDTVIPYFNQFMERYPTIKELAEADEQNVLKSWEGLGYYSRARNLHTAVKEVVEKYDAQVPSDKKELKQLKGIGPYTLGAVLSIAFNHPEPAVDGNVMRVLSRILHIDEDIAKPKTKKLFEEVVKEIISYEDPSSFNQGLMELGALVCHPKNPECETCPVQQHCLAYEHGDQKDLPVKTKQKKQKVSSYYGLVLKNDEGKFFIQKRPDEGLLANMWEFPIVLQEEFDQKELVNWFEVEYGLSINIYTQGKRVRHVFSHVIWEVDVIYASVKGGQKSDGDGKFVTLEELERYPMPNIQQKIKKLIH
ncbi:A/G-specific adenine glycosylase [Tenuibacillus multivorans]|uniref:Adenine DNA glycosylase n=1 Tax=Tenuibacillus multivorans TaxID=237069 RepID=A0A1H0FY71_9BACI|nr:A/G-specific adenine glycosylase [Tenuibacillus multivorans]GEL78160.1 adenine DNA glycosylase [Tenuibacillus multivorans]SDN99595.1 A/G-specific adenine glycosylase [Tenuibacillus multivorans]